MTQLTIRPSIKLVWLLYFVCLLLFAGGAYLIATYRPGDGPWWIALLPAVIFLWPLTLHILRRLTRLTIADGKLRYETGFLSRSVRTMELGKVQDVRVDQTLGQRMLNIGTIAVETAGESSRLSMESVDDPHRVSDRIIEAAHPKAKGETV